MDQATVAMQLHSALPTNEAYYLSGQTFICVVEVAIITPITVSNDKSAIIFLALFHCRKSFGTFYPFPDLWLAIDYAADVSPDFGRTPPSE